MELTSQGVLHGGTYNANASSVAAANATLATLAADDCAAYKRIERTGGRLIEGLREHAARLGSDLLVQGRPAVFNTTFGTGPVRNYRDYARHRPGAPANVPARAPGSRRAGDRPRHVVPVGGARRRGHRGHARGRRRRARRGRLTASTRSARPVA